ncbi:hypothetical protein BZA05DRAFT_477775 [Tricharina praecox]|uniref:uncharacterized protein n=1 Tax=Tricharina praecox TaxID=43433 RepID=UPI0022204E88|nr:uncharacterized protein BZA05DRAFT_477775 [Tricharina praecox]KAI5841626.1 hypothetical protein BZA05DRAFT_477775 [Tricharina praecox]
MAPCDLAINRMMQYTALLVISAVAASVSALANPDSVPPTHVHGGGHILDHPLAIDLGAPITIDTPDITLPTLKMPTVDIPALPTFYPPTFDLPTKIMVQRTCVEVLRGSVCAVNDCVASATTDVETDQPPNKEYILYASLAPL